MERDDHEECHRRIDLKLLRYFLAVAEELHFGRAAQRLHMSQPPLSWHIKELEAELGAALFVRHSRRVELTAAGRALQQEAALLLKTASQGLSRVAQIGRGERGCIRLGLVSTVLWGPLRDKLFAFIRQHPELEIVFHELSPYAQQQALARHEIDLGLWRMAQTEAGLQACCVHQERFVLALPAEHPLAARASVSLGELREESFVTLPLEDSDWRFLQPFCRAAGLEPRVRHEVKEPQTLLALIGMGAGLSLIPESYAATGWPNVAVRPLEQTIPADLYAARHADAAPPAARRLQQALVGIDTEKLLIRG